MSKLPNIKDFLRGVDDGTFLRTRLVPLIESVVNSITGGQVETTEASKIDLSQYITKEQMDNIMKGIGEIHGKR